MQYPQKQEWQSYTKNEQPGYGPIPLTLINREAVRLAFNMLNAPITFKEEEVGAKVGADGFRQKHVEIDVYPEELVCSIDDLSERKLLPAMGMLVEALKRDGISCTRFLSLPHGYDASRVQYGGFALRCIRTAVNIADEISWRPGFRFRFDVLYS